MIKKLFACFIVVFNILSLNAQWSGTNPLWTNSNVGIGISTPSYPLDVRNATGQFQLKSSTGTNYVVARLNNTGGDFLIGRERSTGAGLLPSSAAYSSILNSLGAYPFHLGVNNTIALTVLNGGNVGIGTTTPSQKLQILGGSILIGSGVTPNANSGIRIVAPISATHYNWMIAAQQNVNQAFEITPSTTVGGTTFSTPVIVFNATGNVGIGTTTPITKLDIKQATNIHLGVRDGQADVTAVQLNAFNDDGSANVPMEFKASKYNFTVGNIGIGSTIPIMAKLQIKSTLGTPTDAIAFWTEDGTYNPRVIISHVTASNDHYLQFNSSYGSGCGYADYVFMNGNIGAGTVSPNYNFQLQGATSYMQWTKTSIGTTATDGTIIGYDGGASDNNFYIRQRENSSISFFTNDTQKMLLDANGNLGVGVNPSWKLTVAENRTEDASAYIYNTSSTGYGVKIRGGSDSRYALQVTNYNDVHLMSILGDGKVGIGTTNPGNYLLNVWGRLRAHEVVVNTTGADFVFAPDYKLLNINEIEKFIKEYKHLPDIQPASEMKENGMSVSEMQTKLLQKVEEITLYLIEQNKTIENQKSEIELLKQEVALMKNNEK